jgi:hypothetical protein
VCSEAQNQGAQVFKGNKLLSLHSLLTLYFQQVKKNYNYFIQDVATALVTNFSITVLEQVFAKD